MIGKWHLGSDPTGFDYWNILPGQGVYFDPGLHRHRGRRVIKGYVTDIITDLAIEFLKNRPKDKPFFLMCHHKAPHRPWEPDEKHRRCSPASTSPSRRHSATITPPAPTPSANAGRRSFTT